MLVLPPLAHTPSADPLRLRIPVASGRCSMTTSLIRRPSIAQPHGPKRVAKKREAENESQARTGGCSHS